VFGGELTHHLGYEKVEPVKPAEERNNCRNGTSPKTVISVPTEVSETRCKS
jgi:transposase-like protein